MKTFVSTVNIGNLKNRKIIEDENMVDSRLKYIRRKWYDRIFHPFSPYRAIIELVPSKTAKLRHDGSIVCHPYVAKKIMGEK